MGDYEHPIMEPYHSDFDEPSIDNSEKQESFDFKVPPESLLALSPYLRHIGEEWEGKEKTLKILRKRYKETDSQDEKEWLKAMAVIIKGEGDEKQEVDIPGEIDWIKKEIKQKHQDMVDANRQSDVEWAKELEDEIKELDKILNNLNEGKDIRQNIERINEIRG